MKKKAGGVLVEHQVREEMLRMGEESGYPYAPARIMARAYLTGLSALRDLLRERATGNLRDIYEKTQKLLVEAQDEWQKSKLDGERNFSKITSKEKHMRANFLKMIWETTARYGNKEHRRVQNERKGKIGRLNRLFNMAGAEMRNFAVTHFQFPMPVILGREGKSIIYGYEGDETYPQIQVTHATLPEMDFVDMIRSHVFELCRKCFMNDVPMNEARKYVNLLIYRLSPFLEYLYTSGECGRWGFKRRRKKGAEDDLPDADRILRGIVREIEALYGTTNGRPLTVAERSGEGYEPLGVSLFLDESIRLKDTDEENGEQWGAYLRDLCDDEILRDRDAHWLQAEAAKRARWYGIRLHRILTMGLPQPYNARSIILEGDKFARVGEDFLVIAELPLKTSLGEGRADLIIFRRHLRDNPKTRKQMIVWQPIAVFDIKSKTAFDWWIEKERRTSKKHGTISVPRMQLKRRRFTDDEWEKVEAQTPRKEERIQIDAYTGSLRSEYAKLTGEETAPVPVSGTIVVDVAQDSGTVQRGLFRLISTLFKDYLGDLTPHVGEKLAVRVDEYSSNPLRLALIVHSVDHRQKLMLQEQGEPVDKEDTDCGLNNKNKLVLYCSVPSGSRSGPSAAWIAKYWHGLEYIQSLCDRESIERVVWIDVSGEFQSRQLARTRLRLWEHRSPIQQFFNQIEIVDASCMLQSFLFNGGKMPTLRSILVGHQDVKNNSMIVVSGWEMLESSIPDRLRSALHECKRNLVDDLTERANSVLWFERPRGGEATSSIYQRKKVIPFSDHSPFYGKVKAVVWNLPTRPYAIGQTTPILDELRIIIEQDPEKVVSSIVEVPILCGWSSRFWNQRDTGEPGINTGMQRGRQSISKDDVYTSSLLRDDLLEKALDLIMKVPELVSGDTRREDVPVLFVERMAIAAAERTGILRTPLLTFHPQSRRVRGKRGFLKSSMSTPNITGCRQYRSYIWRNQTTSRNYNPPSDSCLVIDSVDIARAYRLEKDRIYNVLKLMRNFEISDEWKSFLRGLKEAHERCEKQESTRAISEFLKNHYLSAELWEQISWIRERMLPDGLSHYAQVALNKALKENPQLHLDTGNYLLLLLLYMKYQKNTINDDLTRTWVILKTWQLLQLGYFVDYEHADAVGRTVFDLAKILSDMLTRNDALQEIPVPKTPNIRYGRVLVVESEEGGYDYWMVLQKRFRSTKMIAGMWKNVNPIDTSDKFRWSVNSHDILATSAKKAREVLEYDDIAITDSYDGEILWVWSGDALDKIGTIELLRRGSKESQWIRGIRVQSSLKRGQIESSFLVRKKVDISKLVVSCLIRIQELNSSCIPVECTLGLDGENYVVVLHASETDEQDVVETLVFERTQELVDFLRLPLVTEKPVTVDSGNDCLYTWNPYTDIHYGDVGIVRPFVERKNPFTSTKVTLPETAKEFIQSTIISVGFKIKHDVHQCPICLGIGDDHAACWVLENKIDDVPYGISSILGVGLTDTEIYELIQSRVVHCEGTRYEIDIEFPDEENYDDRLIFRESRFFAWHLGARRILPSSFLEMKNEKLECDVFRDGKFIVIYVKSDITGDLLYSGPLIQMSKKMSYKEMKEQAQDVLNEITENRYGKRCAKNKVKGYDILLSQITNIIKNGAWKK
jgi:hypothetical protein